MIRKRIIAVVLMIVGAIVAIGSEKLGDARQRAEIRNLPVFQRLSPTREPVDETVGISYSAEWIGYLIGSAVAIYGMSLWKSTAPSKGKPPSSEPGAD